VYNNDVEQEDKILEFIDKHDWRFAKSMPFMPHWYVVRENCDEKEFLDFVIYIRQYGEERAFGKKRKFVYLDIGQYTYWTMGNTLDITKIINRARIK
jgi:hypothetical protein